MTTEEQLNEINMAISAITNGGEEYQISNRRLRRAPLSVLLAERQRLENKLAAEQGKDIAMAYLGRR